MDIKILKDITKLMNDNDLVEVEVESKGLKIKLRKAAAVAPPPPPSAAVLHAHPPLPAPTAPPAGPLPAAAAAAPAPAAAPPARSGDDPSWKPIISPIPGTVYLKPNPDAPPFVTEGSPVDPSKVVCLVEAMKVFNEIKPEPGVSGQIKRICVSDGQPVEYGTVLFLVG
ncbi:MAG: acetyl-CoA carboxylase biotin carboxyl carrier protein [Planctomycetota bacterium]|nr:acetyl-CoA carboxylase biotin carboxyl carrier protein [Planctomycetota bacterium]